MQCYCIGLCASDSSMNVTVYSSLPWEFLCFRVSINNLLLNKLNRPILWKTEIKTLKNLVSSYTIIVNISINYYTIMNVYNKHKAHK